MSRVLLDTQVFCVAAIEGIHALPKKVQTILADPNTERLLSAASIMEVVIKDATGKLKFAEAQAHQAAADLKLTQIPFTPQYAYRLYSLPLHHRDPFDRMLIATALVENVSLIGGDGQFKKYKGLKVIW